LASAKSSFATFSKLLDYALWFECSASLKVRNQTQQSHCLAPGAGLKPDESLPRDLLVHLHSLVAAAGMPGIKHTHPFNGPFSGTTHVSRYQKGKTNLDFTEVTDSEWQWHPLGHMQVCTLLQSDNHASTLPLRFLQAGCPSCCPTNSEKALKVLNSVM